MSLYLKIFSTHFAQITSNKRNENLASFFHDLVAVMSCFYFRKQFEHSWILFFARFEVLISQIDIALIIACDEPRVGLAKMLYLLWINGLKKNVNVWISVVTGRTEHNDQVTAGPFQTRRNRHFAWLLLLCLLDKRIGSYFNRLKYFIRVCQNSSDLMLEHYVTFSQYFIDMPDDEIECHVEHVTEI